MSRTHWAIIAVFGLTCYIYYTSGDKPYTENLGVYTVTAYCPCRVCCGRYSDGITASGHKIQLGDHFVAAPPEIPFGTMLIIPGYNLDSPVEVLDRGGAIVMSSHGKRLDVFFPDHEMALQWGVQKLSIAKVNYRGK